MPTHLSLPSATTPTRSHSASHSSIACVVSTTVSPRAARSIASHIIRRPSGHIPLEGSSRSNTRGRPTSAIASVSLRLFPPLYSPQGRSANAESPTMASVRSAAATASSSDDASYRSEEESDASDRSDSDSLAPRPLSPLSLACISTVSRPVRNSRSGSNCGQYPTALRAASVSSAQSKPRTRARPPLGRTSPRSAASVVLFPAPFTPRSPNRSPRLTPNASESTAAAEEEAPAPRRREDAYVTVRFSRTTSYVPGGAFATATRSAATSASSSKSRQRLLLSRWVRSAARSSCGGRETPRVRAGPGFLLVFFPN